MTVVTENCMMLTAVFVSVLGNSGHRGIVHLQKSGWKCLMHLVQMPDCVFFFFFFSLKKSLYSSFIKQQMKRK